MNGARGARQGHCRELSLEKKDERVLSSDEQINNRLGETF